jgi:hypothetical protein
MLKRSMVAAVAAVLIGLVTTPAGPAAASRFRARLDLVQVAKTPDEARCGAEPRVRIDLTGEGRVTRIGRVTAEGSHCTIDDPSSVPFDGGILVVSAADGDINIDYSGTDNAGALDGIFTIVDGTGAYAGATGGGTLSGAAVPGEERGRIVLDGWID